MLFAAKGLAMTAFDVFTNTDLVKKMNEEFKQGE